MTTKPMTKKARAAMRHAIVKEFGVPQPIWGPKAKPQAKPRAEKITPEERKHRRMMKGAWSEICKTMDYRRIRKIDWSVEKNRYLFQLGHYSAISTGNENTYYHVFLIEAVKKMKRRELRRFLKENVK